MMLLTCWRKLAIAVNEPVYYEWSLVDWYKTSFSNPKCTWIIIWWSNTNFSFSVLIENLMMTNLAWPNWKVFESILFKNFLMIWQHFLFQIFFGWFFTKYIFSFCVDLRFKKCPIRVHSFNSGQYEKMIKIMFTKTINVIEAKLYMNIHWMVPYTFIDFILTRNPKWTQL